MTTLFYYLLLISTKIITLSAECGFFERPPNQNGCIKPKWSQQGITVAGDGTEGNSNVQISHPFCIFLDQNDDLTNNIVIDTKHFYPGSLYPDKQGNIFVLQLSDGGFGAPWQLMKYSTTTSEKTPFAVKLDNPNGLFVDECGTVYTANALGTTGGTIQKIVNVSDAKGIILVGDLNEPSNVTLDRYGNVYFVERGKYRIQRMSVRDGRVETVVDKQGVIVYGTEYWNDPQYIAFDSKHNLYVSDYKNYRVQKFLFEGGDLYC
ncbi:unnamed protein product [Rotaria sordida]|uniref:SMP-30/Gluconolactonase/LRE-like region domain-containing protein n=1 Tax=Rotaria sordida TaxID=392033 RepID=A0A818ULS2_9BILA|nr:unnamed protein product [Rotaria sordida]CAF3698929.1 unnamed protein product [Rotaria sordida]